MATTASASARRELWPGHLTILVALMAQPAVT